MFSKSLAALALASVVGCSTSTNFQPFAANGPDERAQFAAYAATAKYPSEAKPSEDFKAIALINPKNESVKLVNYSDEAIRDANIWVNGSFVYRVGTIPSHGSVVVDREQFYDSNGETMRKLNSTANRVEVQLGDHLYRLGNARTE